MMSKQDSGPQTNQGSQRKPRIWEAFIPLVCLVFFLVIHLQVLKMEDPHLAIMLGVAVAAGMGLFLGYPWSALEDGLVEGIQVGMKAVLILMVVGMLISTWIAAGVVPLLIHYGLALLNPKIFYVAACLICSVVSLATGSSWTTAGTVGVALIGVASGLGLSESVAAGAIVSGAYFGDKLSPLSDSTNLAPAVVGAELFAHIRHMLFTTLPAMGIALVLYGLMGLFVETQTTDTARIEALRSALATHFNLSPWLLLAPISVLIMVWKKLPALPSLFVATVFGVILGLVVQGRSLHDLVGWAFSGYASSSGHAEIDELLSKGGLEGMMWTISLVFCALGFGGIMMKTHMLETIALWILKYATSNWKLVGATNLSCILMNLTASDQYLAISVPGKMFRQAFLRRGLDPLNLSRALEDAGTLTSPLILWNTCGATMKQYLGVSPFAFAPFAFFNWLSPIISIISARFGWGIKPLHNPAMPTTETENLNITK